VFNQERGNAWIGVRKERGSCRDLGNLVKGRNSVSIESGITGRNREGHSLSPALGGGETVLVQVVIAED